MKILYAIQGTGNGHLARATEIIPELKKYGETHILVSGIQGDLNLPFQIDYQFYGLSFINGKKGGVNFLQTLLKLRLVRMLVNIISLPVHKYDLVISDFEPVSSWACLLKGKKCIGLSHQNSVLHPKAPQPNNLNIMGRFILKFYAYTTVKYGFHFDNLDNNHYTPIVRSGIRNTEPKNYGYYTVYLPAYSDSEIEKILAPHNDKRWEVFSKSCKSSYQKANLIFNPISMDAFTKSFINCEGIITTAGFETPSEAIYMGKKLCVVPMNNQYEQSCNAAFLSELGACVINKIQFQQDELKEWIESKNTLKITYVNQTDQIINHLIFNHGIDKQKVLYQWRFQSNNFKLPQLRLLSFRGNKLITMNTNLQSNIWDIIRKVFK